MELGSHHWGLVNPMPSTSKFGKILLPYHPFPEKLAWFTMLMFFCPDLIHTILVPNNPELGQRSFCCHSQTSHELQNSRVTEAVDADARPRKTRTLKAIQIQAASSIATSFPDMPCKRSSTWVALPWKMAQHGWTTCHLRNPLWPLGLCLGKCNTDHSCVWWCFFDYDHINMQLYMILYAMICNYMQLYAVICSYMQLYAVICSYAWFNVPYET